MRKLSTILAAVLIVGLLAGCGGNANKNAASPSPAAGQNAEQGKYKDGAYYAESEYDEKGMKGAVVLNVKDGKITDVNWTEVSKAAGPDKKELSKTGKYGMKEKGKAQSEWHEQAEKVEKFLVEKQDLAALALKDEEGHTDAVSGVSIKVKGFTTLVTKALAAGPVEAGPYKDGAYHAEQAAFADSGWKYKVDLTVLNGKIVAVNWNGVNKDGGDDKKTLDKAGKYGMKEKAKAQGEWYEEAEKAEAFLIEKQDPKAATLKDDGTTDAITGVSINVKDFFQLVEEALKNAKK
ncbi:FMN-binding protein [Paenibacillus sp. N1-5-1-14]|uniref:FMN-binding protein n=1 Tax=Paenibacillus radicibacter TaxID=2972488 RepID=UPI00215918A1|nr:FMN-binding protein [Paenibacillus radicibacter]MCR8645286.1 FMN-binding protein [Paenibacillus radicibacter]